jgi:hypothetical protein
MPNELTVEVTAATPCSNCAALRERLKDLDAEIAGLRKVAEAATIISEMYFEAGSRLRVPFNLMVDLRDALESSVALTDKCRAQSIEIADYKARLNLEIESRAELQRQLAETPSTQTPEAKR